MLSHHVSLLDFELLLVQMCGPSMIVRAQCEQTPGQCLFCAHITGESAYPDFDSEAQTRPDGALLNPSRDTCHNRFVMYVL